MRVDVGIVRSSAVVPLGKLVIGMSRLVRVLLAALLLATLIASPASAKVKWDYPPVSVVHASDGMGLTNGSLSLHRVFSSRHGMLDTFDIYGAPYTWTRPADSAFLQPGWAYDSVVACLQCHSAVTATSSTPAVGHPGPFETLRLDAGVADGMSSTTGEAVICEKCHDLLQAATWSNSVHGSSKHRGTYGQCVMCHTQLPHGSGLPRILGYSGDPSPYSTAVGGLTAIQLQSYTPTSWMKRDCVSSCHAPGGGLAPWPSGGSVGGTVRTTTGDAVSGATVTVSTIPTTSDASGVYRIDNIGVGYATVRVSAAGYASWSQYVTITGGSLLTVDPVLTPLL